MPLQITLIDWIEDAEILEETKNIPSEDTQTVVVDYTTEVNSLFKLMGL